MKKIVGLFFILGLSSCLSVPFPKPKHFVAVIDYTELTSKGFFVTESNSVSFPYQPVGSILVEEIGGWRTKRNLASGIEYNDLYVETTGDGRYLDPNTKIAMIRIGDELKKIGATGIINLKMSRVRERDVISGFMVEKIIISGMAIKKE